MFVLGGVFVVVVVALLGFCFLGFFFWGGGGVCCCFLLCFCLIIHMDFNSVIVALLLHSN